MKRGKIRLVVLSPLYFLWQFYIKQRETQEIPHGHTGSLHKHRRPCCVLRMASRSRTNFCCYLHCSVPTGRGALACTLNVKHMPSSISCDALCFKEEHRMYILMESRLLSEWQRYILLAVTTTGQIHANEPEHRIQPYENVWTQD